MPKFAPVAPNAANTTTTTCYHCGEDCPDHEFHIEDKYFCCFGCKTVYEILKENDLCSYYDMQEHPGRTQRNKVSVEKYAVLDKQNVREKFIRFADGNQTHVTFYLPTMHCSSCIWLLENMHQLNNAILQSRVDFPKKEITLVFDESKVTLGQVAAMLDTVGYEPLLSLQDIEKKPEKQLQKSRLIKIGISGFAFGNIMMMAFPEYLAGGDAVDQSLTVLFRYLSLFLALPVFFYCAGEFYTSSWKSLKNNFLNIDVPIALAIIFTFGRSLYAVFVEHSSGYFDSMTGIVFFMLVGRYFQDLTYKTISFDRDYKSYFPLSVTQLFNGAEQQIPLSDVKEGDTIVVRNHELIPADALLLLGKGNIDYSFVTGEADPVDKKIGELIYAGGKQVGSAIQLRVIKPVEQSYLTQLWNNIETNHKEDEKKDFVQTLGRYFALIVLIISSIAAVYWLIQGDVHRAADAFITPMIVACPCALLLSATFTNGNAIRYFGNFGIYLKNAQVIAAFNKIDTIVFDKTGTLTQSNTTATTYTGAVLSEQESDMVATLAAQSNHPYSRAISNLLGKNTRAEIANFREFAGKGISALVNNQTVKIGSALFVGIDNNDNNQHGISYVSIDDTIVGHFNFANRYRAGFDSMIAHLGKRYHLYLLSGDNDSDKAYLSSYFDADKLKFEQTPHDKLAFIKQLQSENKHVMMLGDGLNDAGALQQSNVGIAVSQNSNFTPASDVVMDVNRLTNLPNLFSFAKAGKLVITGSFILSILYNLVGLYFALQGLLAPVVAAILMPLSTITIVSFTTGMTTLAAKRLLKK
jgi:P-type Cu+ transporter